MIMGGFGSCGVEGGNVLSEEGVLCKGEPTVLAAKGFLFGTRWSGKD